MNARQMGVWAGMAALAVTIGLGASVPAVSQGASPKPEELTPEELKERDARKGCRISICSAFHVRKSGPDISCDILKSWRKDHITRMVSKGGLNWVWGRARCTTTITLPRQGLIDAMAKADFDLKLAPHSAACEIERPSEQPYTLKVSFAPTVSFKAGKAVKAGINWGDIEAPLVVKGALWTLTSADNKLAVLQPSLIADINDFIEAKCLEIKSEWQK